MARRSAAHSRTRPSPARVASSAWFGRLDARTLRVRKLIRRVTAPVTGLGWSVVLLGGTAWLIAGVLGWVEFAYLATTALLLVVLCLLTALGKSSLSVDLEVEPSRVTVGMPAVGRVSVRNSSARRTLPVTLELPVGDGAVRFNLNSLAADAEQEEIFVVPTLRRGVIPVGPVMTVRGDPIGLIRREVTWSTVVELFAHPVTVPLESVGFGLLRDLEGRTTNEVSMSDLAFHALRDYQPGDDRRYIHWRSSAKAGKFLVRQFLDTRRLHLAAIVDSDAAVYASPDDFETAISVAASLALCSVRAEQETTVLAGRYAVPTGSGRQLLDALTRAELGSPELSQLTRTAVQVAPGLSLAFLITGPRTGFAQLQRAALNLPFEAKQVAIVVDPNRPVGMSATGNLIVLSLQVLSDLPVLLRGADL